MSMPRLEELIGTASFENFRKVVLESAIGHFVDTVSPKRIDELLSLDTLQGLYDRTPLFPDRFQVITNGTVVRNPQLHPQGGIDPRFIANSYASGSSLRVTSIQDLLPPVGSLCKDLAKECMCHVSANIYVTPPGNPGFDPHYDDHDVLILQCHGSKDWSIHDTYEGERPLPLAGFTFEKGKHVPGGGVEELKLKAGDTLYIPRGKMHSARTGNASQSVHITFALNWITWNELIFDMLATAAIEQVELRKAVLPAMWRECDLLLMDNVSLRKRVQKAIEEALTSVSPEESFNGLRANYEGSYFDARAPIMFTSKCGEDSHA